MESEQQTFAQLLHELGDIPPGRVRCQPRPGTATVADLIEVVDGLRIPCELVDGTLVDRAIGFRESVVSAALLSEVVRVVSRDNLGAVTGARGTMEILPGLVRSPDVAFTSWSRMPGERIPEEPVPRIVPDLVAEVLRRDNTGGEMERKVREFVAAGAKLIWVVDPLQRTVAEYNDPEHPRILNETQTLDGGDVLSGFALPVRDVFAELNRRGES